VKNNRALLAKVIQNNGLPPSEAKQKNISFSKIAGQTNLTTSNNDATTNSTLAMRMTDYKGPKFYLPLRAQGKLVAANGRSYFTQNKLNTSKENESYGMGISKVTADESAFEL